MYSTYTDVGAFISLSAHFFGLTESVSLPEEKLSLL
jgi:hypothetical protein